MESMIWTHLESQVMEKMSMYRRDFMAISCHSIWLFFFRPRNSIQFYYALQLLISSKMI